MNNITTSNTGGRDADAVRATHAGATAPHGWPARE